MSTDPPSQVTAPRARPTEIDYPGAAGIRLDVPRIVARIVAGAHRPRAEAAREVLIEFGSGRLRLPLRSLHEVLALLKTHPPLVAELVELCRKSLLNG